MRRLIKSAALLTTLALGTSAFGLTKIMEPANLPIKPDFAVQLYKELSKSEGNLFFSPISIQSALAMASEGAKADTLKQMQEVAKLDGASIESIAQLMIDLKPVAPKAVNEEVAMPQFELSIANAVWSQPAFPFNPAYVRRIKQTYAAQAESLDFVADPNAARKTINDWVEKQTREKIKNLLPEGSITEQTRLVLTNAVYFNAAWTERFNEDQTADAPFHLSVADNIDGPKSKTVKMMQQQERLGYFDAGDFEAVSLPYALGQASMLILVPKKIGGIADVERWLSEQSVADLPDKLKVRQVALSLPRIKMEQSASLVPVLKRMGMTLAFDPGKADFSGMSESEKLMITDVLHKAYVKVDEKGTEAAAATGVVVGVTAMPMPEEPVVVRADRPFVMIIRENKTNGILFMGRVMDPG